MKAQPSRSSRSKVFTLIFTCLSAALLSSRLIPLSAAQDCITPPPNLFAAENAWNQNARVRVVINSNDFTPQDYDCLSQAFANWNAMSGVGGKQSGVKFTVEYSNATVVTQGANGVVVGDDHAFQVNRQVYTSRPDALAVTDGASTGTWRTNAITYINPQTGNDLDHRCEVLTKTMAHEIGHTFGLGDFTTQIPPGTSVMKPADCADPSQNPCTGASDFNTRTGTAGPTPCDNGRVKEISNYSYPPCDPVEAQACDQWDPVLCECLSGDPGGYCDPSIDPQCDNDDDGGFGCDAGAESQCYSSGGSWDSYFCSCEYGCDPYGYSEANCYNSGGWWDPDNCYCGTGTTCVMGPAQQISETNYQYTAPGWPDSMDCTDTTYVYRQCCEDGSNCVEWEEYYSYCCTPTNWGCL